MKFYNSFLSTIVFFGVISFPNCNALPKKTSSNPILASGYLSKAPADTGASISRRTDTKEKNPNIPFAIRYDAEHESIEYLNVDKKALDEISQGGENSTSTTSTGPSLQKRRINGIDDRMRVCDTTKYPASVTGRLTCPDNLNSSRAHSCSATLIGPRTILTAAHCVFDAKLGSNTFFKGCYFQQYLHSSCSGTKITLAWTVQHLWIPYRYSNPVDKLDQLTEDMAVAHLTTTDTKRGSMAFGYDPNLEVGDVINMNGYPGDLNPRAIPQITRMFHVSGSITRVSTNLVHYDADVTEGQSGSAIYVYTSPPERRVINAIAHAEIEDLPNLIANVGVRINSLRFNTLCAWLENGGTRLQGCP